MRYHIHSLLTTITAMMLVSAVSFAQTSERFRENGASAESVAFPEGRICFKDGGEIVDEWYVKDHVGSVRFIVDLGASVAEEAILFQSDYSPYGRRVVTVRCEDTEGNRYGFSGKESSIEGDPDVFLDFGARYWSPVFYTWLSRDPKADSYCSVSPYVYCAGDPVNFIDPDGKRPIYNKYGDFVGVTESGMQGLPFVIPEYKKFRRLTDDEAELEDVGTNGFINKESFERFLGSYMDLKHRPDWDGYITLREANEWYRTGNGQRLYVDLNKVDFSGLRHVGKVGEEEVISLFKYSFSPNDKVVLGSITK